MNAAQRQPVCSHRGELVWVGGHRVFAAGLQYLQPGDLDQADLIVPLAETKSTSLWPEHVRVFPLILPDFGGVPRNWETLLQQEIIPALREKLRVYAFCFASHGRTGTFLASLIALLEPRTEDPIAAVRKRHCMRAVETRKQAEAIYALRGESLPGYYRWEFRGRGRS